MQKGHKKIIIITTKGPETAATGYGDKVDSGYMTGQVLHPNGGEILNG